jgi:hypothetical protein
MINETPEEEGKGRESCFDTRIIDFGLATVLQ